MVKVLFVCLGNICRSPMAEGLMRKFSEQHGLDFEVDSAATSTWELGNPPHRGTQEILRREQIDFSEMYSRPVTAADFREFDWLSGMDQRNVDYLRAMAPKGTEHKIYHYLLSVREKVGEDIPDPFYTGDFEQTYQLLSAGLQWWAAQFLFYADEE